MSTLMFAAIALADIIRVPDDAATLDEAIRQATTGDVIVLGEGPFVVGESLPAGVRLQGAGEGTVLTGEGADLLDLSGDVSLVSLVLDGEGSRRAIRHHDGLLVLDDVVLRRGSTNEKGGLLRAEGGQVVIRGGRIETGQANKEGGVVFVENSLTFLDGVQISGGTGSHGGLIEARGGTLWAVDSTFSNGEATSDHGGAVRLRDNDSVFSRCTFTDNVARKRGGSIAIEGGSATLFGVTITNGRGEDGGAIEARDSTVRLHGLTVTGVESNKGAVNLRDAESVELFASTLRDNNADLGAGLYVRGTAISVVETAMCNNIARTGGGVYIESGTVDAHRSLYLGNIAFGDNGDDDDDDDRRGDDGPRGDGGGAVYIGSGTWDETRPAYLGNRSWRGAAVRVQGGSADLVDAIVANQRDGVALSSGSSASATTPLFHNNNRGDNSGFSTTGALSGNPQLDAEGACDIAGTNPSVDSNARGPGVDGVLGPGGLIDADSDGISALVDCDDADASVQWPVAVYADIDGDGVGGPLPETVDCPAPGDVLIGGDCDDADAEVNPSANEVCGNGLDDDCDGVIDEDDAELGQWWYRDLDLDGFGDPTTARRDCVQPIGYVVDNTDCDDLDPDVYPGAPGVVGDGVDQNCDGLDETQVRYRNGACSHAPASATFVWLAVVLLIRRRRSR